MATPRVVTWLLDLPVVRRSDALRSFVTAAWLGWQIESNWADPFLFAIYSVARPVAGVMILVLMYSVIRPGATGEPLFAWIYLGNALYILVGMIITGVSWAVIDDREHYRTDKQLHTAPMDHYAYLYGRGVARLAIGTVSVLITIAFGIVVFDLPLHVTTTDWPLLATATVLGVGALAAVGIAMGSATMMMARHFWQVGEAVAGALFLFTGAIFPLETLPPWLRWIGFLLPVTYWLEAARRALLGPEAAGFPTLAAFDDGQLVLVLLGFALAGTLAARRAYDWALHQAKERGLIDITTSY